MSNHAITVGLSAGQPDQAAAPAVPTAVFYADPRATTFLLRETISSLLASYGIQRALVRLSSPADLVIAQTLVDAGIAYEELEFLGDENASLAGSAEERDFDLGFDERPGRDEPLRAQAAGRFEMSLEHLADVNANVVLVPAKLDSRLIDFSPNTVVGRALAQAEQLDREVLVIVPPERGIRRVHPHLAGSDEPAVTPGEPCCSALRWSRADAKS
jgi:hypothetical protein